MIKKLAIIFLILHFEIVLPNTHGFENIDKRIIYLNKNPSDNLMRTLVSIQCYSASFTIGTYINENSVIFKNLGLGNLLIKSSDKFAIQISKNLISGDKNETLEISKLSLLYYDEISKKLQMNNISVFYSALWRDYFACQKNQAEILK